VKDILCPVEQMDKQYFSTCFGKLSSMPDYVVTQEDAVRVSALLVS